MDRKLKEYARLVIEVGLNIQKGQKLRIAAPIQSADFARLCAEAAYDVGCAEVVTDFMDAELTRLRYLRADDGVFDACPDWLAQKMNAMADEGWAFLSIAAEDPDMLRGVDPDRMRRESRARGMAMQGYHAAMMSNRARWCVVSVPIPVWAQKVFADKAPADAEAALWEAIYSTLRITGDGEAVARWRAHAAATKARCAQLNALNLTRLHYKNGLGTDLVIGLPEGTRWEGGSDIAADGVEFIANMPTEEIFTAPHRLQVDGRVVSSMPFVLNGSVIERFAFTFEGGKIVGVEAGTAEEVAQLEAAIAVDEGACRLGEVALVPYDSPISRMGILFYNTLFDENASCHLAFGKAYPTIEGGGMTGEELLARGFNDSFTHQDFMVGTADLEITGTCADGRTVAIFEGGNFAF